MYVYVPDEVGYAVERLVSKGHDAMHDRQHVLETIEAGRSMAQWAFFHEDLSGIDFDNQDMTGCIFFGCNLDGAKFRGAVLRDAVFSCCSSDDAPPDFIGANVAGSVFDDTPAAGLRDNPSRDAQPYYDDGDPDAGDRDIDGYPWAHVVPKDMRIGVLMFEATMQHQDTQLQFGEAWRSWPNMGYALKHMAKALNELMYSHYKGNLSEECLREAVEALECAARSVMADRLDCIRRKRESAERLGVKCSK